MEEQEAIERLRQWIKPGDTVYTILRSTSRSGMTRVIGLVVFLDGEPIHPNVSAGVVLGRRVRRELDGIVCQGGEYDLVFSLAHRLFGDGHALKQRWL